MNHDKSIELPGSGTLTRRQMVKVLTAASAGVAVSPPISGLAATGETNTGNGARMAAAMFFESHKAAALQRALRYAGDDGFVASMPQLLHARANADYGNIGVTFVVDFAAVR